MNGSTVAFYAAKADARERDPIITPGEHGRADVANGRMSKWLRFNHGNDLVWITDIEGRARALTRNQANVYQAIREIAGTGTRVTMHALGARLGIAASTVYRACIKLQAFGIIAYQANRGRLGGAVFLMRSSGDGLDWCRDAAKAVVLRWWKASEERISRLRRNVASYFPTRETELYEHDTLRNVTGRNIYPEWTPEDFREAGLM